MSRVQPECRGSQITGPRLEADSPIPFPSLAAARVLLSRGWLDFEEHMREEVEHAILPEDDAFSENGDAPSDIIGCEPTPPGRRGRHRDQRSDKRHAEDSGLDGFGRFLRQAAQVALLTHEQEIELAKQIESGNRAAVNRLIEANIRLAVSMAEPLARVTQLPIEDLVQEGTFGLRRAAEKFDWRRGNKFSTYATWWILQAMRRFIARQKHTLHISSQIHERLVQIRRTMQRLSLKLGRDPTEQEIADAMGLPPQKVGALLVLSLDAVPLDAPLRDWEDPRPRDEGIEDETTLSPEEEVIRIERRAQLDEVLSRVLAPRERTVLCLLFGYPEGTPLTLLEVADQFGITPDMVKRIKSTALAKLRRGVALTMLRDFLDINVLSAR